MKVEDTETEDQSQESILKFEITIQMICMLGFEIYL